MATVTRNLTCILPPHGICFRSKNFTDRNRAQAIADRVRSHPAYRMARAILNPRTKRPQWFVCFQPEDALRERRMRQAELAKRAAKAADEGPHYIFRVDKISGRAVIACMSLGGETYRIDPQGWDEQGYTRHCSCPDAANVNPLCMPCKHEIAARKGLGTWQ